MNFNPYVAIGGGNFTPRPIFHRLYLKPLGIAGNALVTFPKHVRPKNAAEILKISLLVFPICRLENRYTTVK